jgi:hypothetical protein
MVYELLNDFVLAVSHLSDAEFCLAAGMASFGGAAVAVLRALYTAHSLEWQAARIERDEAA